MTKTAITVPSKEGHASPGGDSVVDDFKKMVAQGGRKGFLEGFRISKNTVRQYTCIVAVPPFAPGELAGQRFEGGFILELERIVEISLGGEVWGKGTTDVVKLAGRDLAVNAHIAGGEVQGSGELGICGLPQ